MRFITGLVFGIFLTIGSAYVVDAMHAPPVEGTTPTRMVNWNVVSENLSGFSSDVQTGWSKLVSGTKEIDKKIEKGS